MIHINYDHIENCITGLWRLAQESVQISIEIPESKGETAQAERDMMSTLELMCSQDLPELFRNSAKLLKAIEDAFQRAEQSAQSGYEK